MNAKNPTPYVVQFDYDDTHRWSSLVCPICGDECIHLESVQFRPDEKGAYVDLAFFGECAHRFVLKLDSRKGATWTAWQRLLPDSEVYHA